MKIIAQFAPQSLIAFHNSGPVCAQHVSMADLGRPVANGSKWKHHRMSLESHQPNWDPQERHKIAHIGQITEVEYSPEQECVLHHPLLGHKEYGMIQEG